MLVRELVDLLEVIAPTQYAEAWDNVGLMTGERSQRVERALLTIDLTPQVLEEARLRQCTFVMAYHPPYLKPPARIEEESVVYRAIRASIAIYSPHTALDVAQGGTNDVLADAIGLDPRAPLRASDACDAKCKLIVFVPTDHLQRVSDALFEAGAGRIGRYSSCSFRSAGIGTFFGEEGANPSVGERGQLSMINEVRLEVVVPSSAVPQVIRALRAAHPYEEPAYDLIQLASDPGGLGIGRVGTVQPTQREELFQRIKHALGIDHLLIAGPTDGVVTRAAVCAGSGRDLLPDAIAKGAELYLTGELAHHDALRASSKGVTVVCTLHSASERAALGALKSRLEKETHGVEFLLSTADRDPFVIR
ncbi:MAG: Nif3-like dinuclear metal center hexameric protein [Polyangiales bacterium]